MYHVIGTGITALILYLLSYFLYRQSFYSQQFHRRLWNTILAVAFLATALAGLFLALQINYKWNIPIVKSILNWHVECGIGLSFTGIVHLLWHIPYFTGIFKKTARTAEAGTIIHPASVATNLFTTGFISTSVQLLLLKEIINISGGYELIAGTFLASWLAGSAAGSAIARNSPLSDIRKINLFFCLSPAVSLMLMLFLVRIFLKPGETPSFLSGIVFTLLVLIPFCLVSGFTFAKLIISGSQSRNYIPGKSFSIETTGGIAAGAVVSVLGAGMVNTYELLVLLIIGGLSYTMLTFYIRDKRKGLAFRVTAMIVALLTIIYPPDNLFRHWLLRSVKVISTTDTPYGNITKGQYDDETSTYYNHRLLSYNNDVEEREEDVHYALLQSDRPRTVLLISGDPVSRMNEISKYPVKKIIYVERDPELIRTVITAKMQLPENTLIENDDAFTFIEKTNEKFDAVLDLLPPPSSLMLNRYFTFEFFREVKSKMTPGGVFSCSPGINPDYFNSEGIRYYSSVYNTLKAIFRNVIPVSGGKLYFIASDKDLSPLICQLAQMHNITNSYVGPDYLSDDLISAKTEEVTSQLDKNARINRTGLPVACFYFQAFDLTKDLSEKIPAVILLAALFLSPVFAVKRRIMPMYFSAMSLAAFEIILLLILQTAAGNMYELTGIILAGIMTGLASGTSVNFQFLSQRPALRNAALLIIVYLLSAVAEPLLTGLTSRFVVALLLVITGFLPAFFTGQVFREMTGNETGSAESAMVYSSDLAGSAAGFILFSGLAVPLIGIRSSILILPLLIIAGFTLSASVIKR